MAKKIPEKQLVGGLDPYGAHADELSSGASDYCFAYRAFDLRDRFPAPFPDFRSALEALQSETAYLPETCGEIVAYCRDGRSIEIPRPFFIRNEARFESRAAAQQWVRERQSDIEKGNRFSQVSGIAVANPDDPVDKQVADALAFRDSRLVSPEENDRVCEQVDRWLLDQLAASC